MICGKAPEDKELGGEYRARVANGRESRFQWKTSVIAGIGRCFLGGPSNLGLHPFWHSLGMFHVEHKCIWTQGTWLHRRTVCELLYDPLEYCVHIEEFRDTPPFDRSKRRFLANWQVEIRMEAALFAAPKNI